MRGLILLIIIIAQTCLFLRLIDNKLHDVKDIIVGAN